VPWCLTPTTSSASHTNAGSRPCGDPLDSAQPCGSLAHTTHCPPPHAAMLKHMCVVTRGGRGSLAFTLIAKNQGRGTYCSLHHTHTGTPRDCEDPCAVKQGHTQRTNYAHPCVHMCTKTHRTQHSKPYKKSTPCMHKSKHAHTKPARATHTLRPASQKLTNYKTRDNKRLNAVRSVPHTCRTKGLRLGFQGWGLNPKPYSPTTLNEQAPISTQALHK
jgi:hypothetical protein